MLPHLASARGRKSGAAAPGARAVYIPSLLHKLDPANSTADPPSLSTPRMDLSEFKDLLWRSSHASFYRLDWQQVVAELETEPACADLALRFHTQWVTHGEKIRAQLNDDIRLASVLRQWLPAYAGEPVTLYRGESAQRFQSGRLGLCWTPRRDVAEMFASGLNAVGPGGGVLLKAHASAPSVIAGPGRHSLYLGEEEHTVDPALLTSIIVLNRFPPADRRRS